MWHKYIILDDILSKTVSRHPVHIRDVEGRLSPSSLIPFCGIGRNLSAMGAVKIDQFDIPVCKSFTERVLNDQLCYEVDPNKFIQPDTVEESLKTGIILVLDYNEDRQISLDNEHGDDGLCEEKDLINILVENHSKEKALLYLDTVGKLSFDIRLYEY